MLVITFMLAIGVLNMSFANPAENERRRDSQRLSSLGFLPSSEPADIIESRFIKNRQNDDRTFLAASNNTETIAYLKQIWVHQAWQDDERMLHGFDTADRVIEEIIQLYQSNIWENYRRYLLEYDGASDRTSIEIFQIWGEDSWVNYWRDRFEYDEQGRLVELIWEDWEVDTWIPTDRFIFSYDTDGNIEEVLRYWWFFNNWELDIRESWLYEDGSLIEILEEYWDGSEWIKEYRVMFEYDDDGNNTIELSQYFNEGDEIWVNVRRSLRDFDDQGNSIESIQQSWQDSQWQNIQKKNTEYNKAGNILQEITSRWMNGIWVYSWRDSYEYNDDNILWRILTEAWTGSTWENSVRITFGDPSTNITNGNVTSYSFELLQNYPNPFNPSTTIRFTIPEQTNVSLVIYDMLGRKVTTLVDENLPPGEYSHVFDAAHLASGVYMYQLRAGDFIGTKRLILKK